MSALSDAAEGEQNAVVDLPPLPPAEPQQRLEKRERGRPARESEYDSSTLRFWLPRIAVCVVVLGLDAWILVKMVVAR